VTTPAVYAEGLRVLWFLASRGVEATWDGSAVALVPPEPVADIQALEVVLHPDTDGRSYLQRARKRHAQFLREVRAAKPTDVSEREWRRAIEGLESFLFSGWADEAERCGWTRDELYAVPPLWARIDLTGAALLVGDRAVTEITADAIRVKAESGSELAFYRKPKIDYRVAYEAHLKVTRGNYHPDSEEAHLRALERTVGLFRERHPDANLEDARTTVIAAINRSSTTEKTAL
jgi:hypothetical protein